MGFFPVLLAPLLRAPACHLSVAPLEADQLEEFLGPSTAAELLDFVPDDLRGEHVGVGADGGAAALGTLWKGRSASAQLHGRAPPTRGLRILAPTSRSGRTPSRAVPYATRSRPWHKDKYGGARLETSLLNQAI